MKLKSHAQRRVSRENCRTKLSSLESSRFDISVLSMFTKCFLMSQTSPTGLQLSTGCSIVYLYVWNVSISDKHGICISLHLSEWAISDCIEYNNTLVATLARVSASTAS